MRIFRTEDPDEELRERFFGESSFETGGRRYHCPIGILNRTGDFFKSVQWRSELQIK